ncbi:MAG: T9SS type A sorting domain-containing protein [Bacteroidetes bacterium]|nr:T9SS type A sorting domain-containing protein [Bacteroidota bacterium]
MKKIILFLSFILMLSSLHAQRINEFHYDNTSTDVGEFIEVFIPNTQPLDIDDWELRLYRNDGTRYGAVLDFDADLSSTSPDDTDDAAGTTGKYYLFQYSGIRNTTGGIALINGSGIAIQFISYEGSFDGAAGTKVEGMTSVDVGISEDGSQNGTSIEFNPNTSTWLLQTSPTPGNTNVLPISLTTFTGHTHESTILLDWRTETEQNNDYIAIERSTDNGRTFEKLGTVEGAGTTIIPQNYTFVDERPAIGVNYYRLRQVDLDGSEHLHRTIAITYKTDENVLTYYPTLVKDQVILQASKSFNSDKYIEVSDLNGRILLKDIFSSNAQAHTLDVSTLQPGHYFIRIQHSAEVEVMRFVKL